MTSTIGKSTIDLHIHSNASDRKFTPEQILTEAKARNLKFISITDHDSIASQSAAVEISKQHEQHDIKYMVGIELNVTFSHPDYRNGKEIYLDFLGYQFDYEDTVIVNKLEQLRAFREERARKIIANLNVEFKAEGRRLFTDDDLNAIKATVDGAFGRPHIADYLVKMSIVPDRQAAFDTYLMKCYEPKFPLKLSEAAKMIHDAGGILALAHGNDPSGTSLVKYTTDLNEHAKIIEQNFLEYIDGIECWHSRHDEKTTEFYLEFAKNHKLIMTGGTDCHQKPVRMGSVQIPGFVVEQFY